MTVENLSLFDIPEETQKQINIKPAASLDVVKMEFAGAETLSWKELFSGFDTLHAITYSSGIDFVYQLIGLFEQAEILFGCDEVISYSLQEVMAYQAKMVERMRDTAGKMKLDLVSAENIMSFVIPFPPPAEQSSIVCYLNRKCKTVEGLIAEKQSLIDDLESYKKSLIYEVVTGKRRVC